MAAKITGDFKISENSFPFTAIAFGRIGGQNIGVKLSDDVESKIKELGFDIDEVIAELQRNLIQGNLNLPEGCLLYTSPSPRDGLLSRMPSSA